MAGLHINHIVNGLHLLIPLEDLSLSAKVYAFKVDRLLCEAYRWSRGDYYTLKHAQPDFVVFRIAHQATLFVEMACRCGREGSF